MENSHPAVGPLRILLVLAFVALVLSQLAIIPQTLEYQVDQQPELEPLLWPLLAFAVLEVVCVQVVIVATWQLLGRVREDRIFTEASLIWVDAILWSIVAAWLLLLVAFVYIVTELCLGAFPVFLLLILLGGAVLGLLMLVMRALLRQATLLRTDMESVI